MAAEPAETVPPLGPAAYAGIAPRLADSTMTRKRLATLNVTNVHHNKIVINRFNKEARD